MERIAESAVVIHEADQLPRNLFKANFREGPKGEVRRIHLLGTSVNRDAKGYISYPLEDQEDVSVVLEILGRNYDRAKAAAERRGSQDAKE